MQTGRKSDFGLKTSLGRIQGEYPYSHTRSPFMVQSYLLTTEKSSLDKYYLQIDRILRKTYDARTYAENQLANNFILDLTYFRNVCSHIGQYFAKGIIRSASIELFEPGEVLCRAGTPLKTVYVVLEGSLAVFTKYEAIMPTPNLKENYECLIGIARKYFKLAQKSSKRRMQKDNRLEYSIVILNSADYKSTYVIGKNYAYGIRARCFDTVNHETVEAQHRSTVLVFEMRHVMFWLNRSLELKLAKSLAFVKTNACFAKLQDEFLYEIIQGMYIRNCKKGDVIYRQDDYATSLYMLYQGELRIVKNTHLLLENPNKLYTDREKLLEGEYNIKTKILPYADLTRVYNYRPQTKMIELGIITPFCLFGYYEISIWYKANSKKTGYELYTDQFQNDEGKALRLPTYPLREASVICASQYAIYYDIPLKKLRYVLGYQSGEFLMSIERAIRNKLIYRQTNYAKSVYVYNCNHLDYFYEYGNHTNKLSRKQALQKINKNIQNNLTNNPEVKQFGQQTLSCAYYTNFNFPQMIKKRYALRSETLRARTRPAEGDLESNSSYSDLLATRRRPKTKDQFGSVEQKIIGNSHTWKFIKQRVMDETKISRKKNGSLKTKINFFEPLIDQKFFLSLESYARKLYRQRRGGHFKVSRQKTRNFGSFDTSPERNKNVQEIPTSYSYTTQVRKYRETIYRKRDERRPMPRDKLNLKRIKENCSTLSGNNTKYLTYN